MTKLILIPTPLQDDHPLEVVAKDLLLLNSLNTDTILLVEEHKVARQRWLKWGLPREAIEKFILFNEHTQDKILPEILKELKSGKTAFLLSDCGLPAFCDPGQRLVDVCHLSGVKVTSTPFANSISLSIALSGFNHSSFVFSGFVPIKSPDRQDWMKKELKRSETLIWMETPYRLIKILDELIELKIKRHIFLACDLGGESELLLRGPVEHVRQKFSDQIKKEFVLLLAPL
jgi:16S rRNA (cytidine1402-2'-O)-methyltransferase